MIYSTYYARPLSSLREGNAGVVAALTAKGDLRGRLMDLGLTPGAKVQCLQHSPLGDPTAYLIRGAVIALRSVDAERVLVC